MNIVLSSGGGSCEQKKGIDSQIYCGSIPSPVGICTITLDDRNSGMIISLMLTSKSLFDFFARQRKNDSALAGASRLGLFFALFIRVEFRRLFPATRMR